MSADNDTLTFVNPWGDRFTCFDTGYHVRLAAEARGTPGVYDLGSVVMLYESSFNMDENIDNWAWRAVRSSR